jgi:hypothetical protein
LYIYSLHTIPIPHGMASGNPHKDRKPATSTRSAGFRHEKSKVTVTSTPDRIDIIQT